MLRSQSALVDPWGPGGPGPLTPRFMQFSGNCEGNTATPLWGQNFTATPDQNPGSAVGQAVRLFIINAQVWAGRGTVDVLSVFYTLDMELLMIQQHQVQ